MAAVSGSSSAWLRRFHPADNAANRLVCFPHAGGSATFYFPVSQAMTPSVDVLAIQYPGRQDRRTEPCVESIGELADLVVKELESVDDAPLTFFGHSMGALVAFEVARRMERDGTGPTKVFVSGRRAPTTYRDERVHLLEDEKLIAEIKALSGTDPEVLGNEELLRMVLPAVRKDYKAVETYEYQAGEKLSCPLTALIGDSDPKVTMDEAREWGEQTSAAFELKTFAGGHFYLNSQAGAVMAELKEHLASVGS